MSNLQSDAQPHSGSAIDLPEPASARSPVVAAGGGVPVDCVAIQEEEEEDTQPPAASSPAPLGKVWEHRSRMEEGEGGGAPSRLLWVGNVASEASEALLTQLFGTYGAVDNVSAYPARCYAFIEFKALEDAKVAKAGLQGRVVKGQSLRIEFARPAKPSRHLWIWGVSETITKDQLEAEFKKFGALEDFKLLRDRNSALAEFKRIQDASAAVKGLNKKYVNGDELRVDFLRSQPVKRGYGGVETFSQNMTEEKGSKEGDPSETLWIGFPPPARVDEEGLRRAFILFGEVERITTFTDRSYCFVQFRNVDEASRAKEGLQGRLFNDPRVLIRFSSNEGAPRRTVKDEGHFFPPPHQRGSLVHAELVGTRSPFGAVEWPGPSSPNMNMHPSSRHFALQHDVSRPVMGFGRQAGGGGPGGFMGSPLLRGGMPDARGVPFDGNELLVNSRLENFSARPVLEDRVIIDRDYAQREYKRVKIGMARHSAGPVERGPMFDVRPVEGHEKPQMGGIDLLHSPFYKAQPGLFMDSGAQAGFMQGNTEPLFKPGNTTQEPVAKWKWQGTIAKAGTFVCRVQSFPVGKGIDGSLPGVVNCVARTSLDVLAQHFYQAADFGVIYFVPNGDNESASYQDFVRYLGDKHRAGVANMGDGTTIFLVPPSDFAEKVLNLHGGCLFGLVIKSQSVGIAPPAYQQQSAMPHEHAHQQQTTYSQLKKTTVDDLAGVKNTSTTSTMRASGQSEGLSLTPELVASLTSLLPVQRNRPNNDTAVLNGGGTPVRVSGIEIPPHGAGLAQAENRANINSSLQDQLSFFQTLKSSPLRVIDEARYQQSTVVSSPSYLSLANSQTSGPYSPDVRPAVEVVGPSTKDINQLAALLPQPSQQPSSQQLAHYLQEQTMDNLQSDSKNPTAAVQLLLRQTLMGQTSGSIGLEPTVSATARETLDAGLVQHDGDLEGETNNRFQATLQLAAALLQKMHTVSGSEGATS